MKYDVSAIKQPLESSGMEIPDYAIERMAKCLLPLMRKHFERLQEKNAEISIRRAECVHNDFSLRPNGLREKS
jgi:hypothetical protein